MTKEELDLGIYLTVLFLISMTCYLLDLDRIEKIRDEINPITRAEYYVVKQRTSFGEITVFLVSVSMFLVYMGYFPSNFFTALTMWAIHTTFVLQVFSTHVYHRFHSVYLMIKRVSIFISILLLVVILFFGSLELYLRMFPASSLVGFYELISGLLPIK